MLIKYPLICMRIDFGGGFIKNSIINHFINFNALLRYFDIISMSDNTFIYTFVLSGETPAKKNSRIINTKTGRSFPSKKYSDWHKNALSELTPQRKPDLPINTPVFIYITFTHGDKRRRDSDNGTSSILDLLVDANILEDDNYTIVETLVISNQYEKNNASCVVRITG